MTVCSLETGPPPEAKLIRLPSIPSAAKIACFMSGNVGDFEILARDPETSARRGRLQTTHGSIETPAFMPVGTQATVKAMSPAEMLEMDFGVILANTYHLHARPGDELISRLGGLHRFMDWPRAILTDSGGFQVFSLARLRRITDAGVEFQSPYDGAAVFLGPVEAMAIQRRLGSDIAMAFDECVPYPCEREYACRAVERTLSWAAVCARQPRAPGQLVFGIAQGGVHPDLRRMCAERLTHIGFDGYAIGGVSVGEPDALILRGVADTAPWLPADRPRYLMGVGLLPQMTEAVALGVDLFDCVMPTRYARNGTALTRRGRYPVKAARYAEDPRPIEEGCECYACRRFSRAYVRHLLNVDEILGVRLVTMHNLHMYATFMNEMRSAIALGVFGDFLRRVRAEYREVIEEHTDDKGLESPCRASL